jgi:SAM-dependent methyltransferase
MRTIFERPAGDSESVISKMKKLLKVVIKPVRSLLKASNKRIQRGKKIIAKEILLKTPKGLRVAAVSLMPKRSYIRNTYVMSVFNHDPVAAVFAFKEYNADTPDMEANYDKFLIERSVEFDYVGWPRKIQEYIKGKRVLDVGCGTGLHGIGYVLVGAKSYTGLDPKIDLDDDMGKNSRTNQYEHFGATPRQIMKRMPRIRLIPGTFEDIAPEETFDLIVLHNVTEHLHNIESVFEGISDRLHLDGKVLYHHHNFYCWNGHHLPPRTIDKIDNSDPAQLEVMDWNHLSFDPPVKHYIRRGLNKIRLDELKALTSRFFDIEIWHEIKQTTKEGADRFSPDVLARHPEYTERELTIKNVLCVACHKGKALQQVKNKKPSSRERDMRRDETFMSFYDVCKPYTMTTMERLFGVYRAIEYIHNSHIKGDIVECGVWRGGSMMMAALSLKHFGEMDRQLYLFDTFQGMPEPTEEDHKFGEGPAQEKWDKLSEGKGSHWNYASLEEVREAVFSTGYPPERIHLIKGMVEDTLPENAPRKVSLLRLDTDFYQSTLHEFNHLYPLLARNGVLIIDDFGTWAGSAQATEEYFAANNIVMMLNRLDAGGRIGIKTDRASWEY